MFFTFGPKFRHSTDVLAIIMATAGIRNVILTSSLTTVTAGMVRAMVRATMYTDAAMYLPVEQSN